MIVEKTKYYGHTTDHSSYEFVDKDSYNRVWILTEENAMLPCSRKLINKIPKKQYLKDLLKGHKMAVHIHVKGYR